MEVFARRNTSKGKQACDFIAARVFLQVPTGQTMCIFTEATKVEDKTVWSLVPFSRNLFPNPRAVGHNGILINFFNADLAVFGPAWKRELQLQELQMKVIEQHGKCTAMLRLKTWDVGSPCIFHHAMNGSQKRQPVPRGLAE